MTGISPNKLNEVAEKIFNKLDQKDGSEDGYINKSIWDQFVGGSVEGKQIGNGEKSKINFKIAKEAAMKSIISYLKKLGVNEDLILKFTDEIEAAGVKSTESAKPEQAQNDSEIAAAAKRYFEIKNKLLPQWREKHGIYMLTEPPQYAGDEESINKLIYIINNLRDRGKTEEADKEQQALQQIMSLKNEIEQIEKEYSFEELLHYAYEHKDDFKEVYDFDAHKIFIAGECN